MRNTVVIKGNKAGMTVYLDPEVPFERLVEDVGIKFRESARFWGAVQMTLTLEGRQMTPEEEYRIVNQISENSNIEILCLLDTDANRINRCEKALNDKLMELSAQTGQFYKGNLRSGETLESESSIVIIGDVNPGAKVIAKGNVIILGILKGTVYAGVAGNESAVVVAFEMAPMQIRIADHMARHEAEKSRKMGRGPMVANLENETVIIKPIKKHFLNALNYI